MADWESDGPIGIPDWISGEDSGTPGTRPQQMAGMIVGVYMNPDDNQELLAATLTSGIMRTVNGGQSWDCVTDDLPFPVLGVRQFLINPNNSSDIIALTGTAYIDGTIIKSDDAGETWTLGQPIPTKFNWLSYHPSINNLVFACSEREIYFSTDNGNTWSTVLNPIPPDFEDVTPFNDFYRIIALEDRLIAFSDYRHIPGFQIFECTYSIQDPVTTVSVNWVPTANVVNGELNQFGLPDFIEVSNIALGRYYIIAEKDNNFKALKSTDQGESYEVVMGQLADEPRTNKSVLLASPNHPNIFYHGGVPYVEKYNDLTGLLTSIEGDSGEANGHHDDYRSGQIVNNNGEDRIIFGNDGGVGLVENGLDVNPKITSLNGNLSTNLLRTFNIHEETKRTVFAFHDHAMVYRDDDNSYSNKFLWEGAFAMVQQDFPDAIVGAWGFTIQDRSPSSNDIVSPNISGYHFHGKPVLYRHFPERFAAGLAGGEVALNRETNNSDKVAIDFFQDQGDEQNEDYSIAAVGVSQRNPDFIYAGALKLNSHGTENCLAKSFNDATGTEPWINISDGSVSGIDYMDMPEVRSLTSICDNGRYIATLEVDAFNENLVYCGLGSVFNEWDNATGDFIVKEEKYRVLRSIYGGEPFDPSNPNSPPVWEDWSDGLPAFPVEHLLAIESDNHLIFCATSVGIYYRYDGMEAWECFSEGLPKVRINGMQYDYCDNLLYVATFGRGLWKTPVNLPLTNSFSISVDTDETWDENKTIHTDISVENGAELTITSIIRMATGKKIIVEPGGHLTLDGGTLTNACGEMWQGIEIHGNTDNPQWSIYQGRLETKNDAVIENARKAITTMEPDNWDSRGGMINCRDTKFINNKRSAEFMSYENQWSVSQNYNGFFTRCEFIFNDDNIMPLGEVAPFAQVTLWDVKGVRFNGCTFTNTANVAQSEHRSKAIFSIDASYRVNPQCNVVASPCPTAEYTPGKFEGYHYAIHPQGVLDNAGITVKDIDFDQNMVGIYLDLANGSQIMGNEFVVGSHPYPTDDPFTDDATLNTGVLTEGLTGFIIEDNTFNGDNTITDFTHGVTVQNGGGALVEVYNNEMNNLGSGAIGAGDNDDNIGNGAYGLRFLCNKNTGNSTDIEVRNIVGFDEFGYIDANQAGTEFVSQAAGNTFSAGDGFNTNYVHMDFKSDKSYSYQHNNTDPDEIPDTTNEVYITPPGDIYAQLTTIAHTCPTTETDGGIVKQEYTGIKSEFYNLLFTYHQFIDQGNTEAALNDVALSWSTDAWTLRDQLMARSPNNSDTVLIAAANKNLLPHGMLLEVLVSNPDALQDGTVINHVKCCIARCLNT